MERVHWTGSDITSIFPVPYVWMGGVIRWPLIWQTNFFHWNTVDLKGNICLFPWQWRCLGFIERRKITVYIIHELNLLPLLIFTHIYIYSFSRCFFPKWQPSESRVNQSRAIGIKANADMREEDRQYGIPLILIFKLIAAFSVFQQENMGTLLD